MKTHELKTWPMWFSEILYGHKDFEVRFNDRGFNAGDILELKEYDPDKIGNKYTNRIIKASVLIVWDNMPGLMEGFIIMKIKVLDVIYGY